MRNYLRPLINLSAAKLWTYLSNPSMLPVWFSAPRPNTIEEILLSVFENLEPEAIEDCHLGFLRNHLFFQEINEKMIAKRHRRADFDAWLELTYLLTRFAKPRIIVETGVFDGLSSAVFLLALHENGEGQLISIDFPAVETIPGSTHRMKESTLPPGCTPGWVIPDSLRERHTLHLGDSKKLLPDVLARQPIIDIFLHDSLHTHQHQLFEYSAAWQHLAEKGFLLSDDIFWSAAFHRFCKKEGRQYRVYQGVGQGFGLIRKE